mgnify:CR=1 FL=1
MIAKSNSYYFLAPLQLAVLLIRTMMENWIPVNTTLKFPTQQMQTHKDKSNQIPEPKVDLQQIDVQIMQYGQLVIQLDGTKSQ